MQKVRVILVTDGDERAREALKKLAAEMNLRCITASAGNPTPLSGAALAALIKKARRDPVLVMFDDKGNSDLGQGEAALAAVAKDEGIQVLGAIAVASNSWDFGGARVDFCIDRYGRKVHCAVDKDGSPSSLMREDDGKPILYGDTVGVLNDLALPLVVGVGDIGKMDSCDDSFAGSPITRRAIEEILAANSNK